MSANDILKSEEGILANSNKERGTILIVAILFIFILLAFVAPLLFKFSTHYRISDKTFKSLLALNLAEAGVERAIWELNHGDISIRSGDQSFRMMALDSIQSSGGQEIGDILVVNEDPEGENPVVKSTGKVSFLGSQIIDREIQVSLTKGGRPLFDFGAFANERVELASNITIEGNVGTNSIDPGAIFLNSNSVVNGNAI